MKFDNWYAILTRIAVKLNIELEILKEVLRILYKQLDIFLLVYTE